MAEREEQVGLGEAAVAGPPRPLGGERGASVPSAATPEAPPQGPQFTGPAGGGGRGRVMEWVHGEADHPWGANPGDVDPALILRTVDKLGAIFGPGRYFRLRVDGWDVLPPPPALFVSNHSGGTVIPDCWGLMAAWYKHHGASRIMHPLAHELVLGNELTGRPLSALGIIRADREQAARALRDWQRDVLVMPGGDRDTWRPWKDRYRVNFAGRKGYCWLALKTGVPIVPLGNAGAHDTLIVLSDGERVARRLRLPELFRATIFPVHLSVPWGLGIGPLPHIPLPLTLRYRFGAPIPVDAVEADRDPTAAEVDALDAEVRLQLQRVLDQLRFDAPHRGLLRRIDSRLRG